VPAAVRFELDLRDVPAEVAFAWLRYLYTQEDIALLWPCGGKSPEEINEGESFWMDLLRLSQRVGDWRLQLYAQDTLVAALSGENWTRLAAFGEQTGCIILSEAALMTGMRKLMPAMLRSFEVPAGFPSPDEDGGKIDDAGEMMGDGTRATPISATGAAGLTRRFGRGASACGQVELEVDRRISALKTRDRTQVSLLDLKRASPGQFGELKHRLAEGVLSAQQVAEQLQRCANMFDPKMQREMRRDRVGAFITWETALAGIIFAVIPVLGKLDLPRFLDPLVDLVPEPPDQLKPFTGWMSRMVVLNFIAIVGVVAMFINGLQSP
jgi:hypothetical protein